MQLSDITVEVRDIHLNRIGLIRPEDLNLGATIMQNNVGSWTIKLPHEHALAPVLRTPGSGLIVTGPSDVLFSGPMISTQFDASSADPVGTLTITGITDDTILADRIAVPDPTDATLTHQAKGHDVRSGPAESVIYSYVNANCGPGAVASRQVANLVLAADLGRGGTVSKSARFDQLGPFLADIAQSANLGFRTVQRGSKLSFEVYAVVDRSKTVRLDIWNNTVTSTSVAVTAPTATKVLVAGQGDDTDRTLYLGTSSTADAAETQWGRRIEVFADQRQTTDVTVYQQKAGEILAQQGFTGIACKVTPMDDSTMRFGIDYNVGDEITTIDDMTEYTAPVTGAVILADSSGFKVGVTVGDLTRVDASAAALQKLNTTSQRVTSLESNVESNPDYAIMQMMGAW